jgi:hypothetical protein
MNEAAEKSKGDCEADVRRYAEAAYQVHVTGREAEDALGPIVDAYKKVA